MEWQQLKERIQLEGGRLKQQLSSSISAHEASQDAGYDRRAWGWASLPTVDEMMQHVSSSTAAEGSQSKGRPLFLEALHNSHAFRSPHCAHALAEASGVLHSYEGMSGSLVLPPFPDAAAEDVRALLKHSINAAWSVEAVKQGVGYAKAGNYDEAHRCYVKALELQHDNTDAYVARGAAYANTKQFSEAAHSFRHALSIDPTSRNAAQYLEAVLQRAQQEGITIQQVDSPRQEQEQAAAAATAADHAAPCGTRNARSTTPAPRQEAPGAGHGAPEAAGREERDGTGHETPQGRVHQHTGAKDGSDSDSSSSSSSSSSRSGYGGRVDVKRALAEVLQARQTLGKSASKSKSSKKRRKDKVEQRKSSRSKKHKKKKRRKS